MILLALLTAGACNYKAIVDARDFPRNASGAWEAPARPHVDSVYLVGPDQALPDSASLLADMTLYSPLIWMEAWDSWHSPFILMLQRARKEAKEMGGNAIQVVDCSAGTLTRVRMIARIYALKKPPDPWSVSPDSCIVHVKSFYGRSWGKPTALYFNDSLTWISYGSDLLKSRAPDFGAAVKQRLEECTLKFDHDGILSIPDNGVNHLPHKIYLMKGSEYYIYIHYSFNRYWKDHSLSTVSKEQFELNQYQR